MPSRRQTYKQFDSAYILEPIFIWAPTRESLKLCYAHLASYCVPSIVHVQAYLRYLLTMATYCK